MAFVRKLGLPASLSDFGDAIVVTDEIAFLADKAMTAEPHVRNWASPLDFAQIQRAIARIEAMA